MKKQEVTIRGKINNKGELVIFGLNDYKKFIEESYINSGKEGCDVLLNLSVMPKNGKKRREAYIHAVIYPQFQAHFKEQGLRYTNPQIKLKVNQMTSACRGRDIEQLNWQELGDFIDECKEIAAEHFHFTIEDSIVI